MLEALALYMVLSTTDISHEAHIEPAVSVYTGGGGGDPDNGEPDPEEEKKRN